MSAVGTALPATAVVGHDGPLARPAGPLARLGLWAADYVRAVAAGSGDGVAVSLTGAAGRWSDFNAANRSAMMKSELLSWPVALAILVLPFGSPDRLLPDVRFGHS